jgi:glycosyltransferase involved in cell wall biosynthesis
MLFEKGPVFYLEFNLRLFLSLLFKTPSIIFSVDLDTLPGCRLAHRFRSSYLVFDSHEYFPEVPELQHRPMIKKIWTYLERRNVPGIDFGITVCEPIAQMYQSKYQTSFCVIRNMPDQTNLSSPVLINSSFTLIYQGAVNMGRGLKEIIQALQLIEDVNLIVVGDGGIKNDIEDLVKQLGLSKRIQLAGKVPFNEIPKFTQQAHLGLCLMENIGLNYYYSLPNRLFDLIQQQVPILAIDFPEIKKVIDKYNVGICVSSLDPEILAQTILEIKQQPDVLKKWQLNQQKAAQELIWETDAHHLNALKKLLK